MIVAELGRFEPLPVFVAKPLTPSVVLQRIHWVASDKRQFVDVVDGSYVGPDRRFKFEGPPPGSEGRRETDLPVEPVPQELDYDMWLGPAPKRPFNINRFHRTHYFNWDYCGGMTASWGIHLFDIVFWVMPPEVNRVSVSGGQYFYKHNIDTPDTLEAVFDCPGYTMTYSLRQANGFPLRGEADHGIYFFGTEGTLFINRSRYEHYTEKDRKTPVIGENRGMDMQHKQKFLDSLKNRKITDSDVETGHLSGIPAHLANIAYRTGRSIQWDNQNQTIIGDPDAARYLSRAARKPWDLI